MIDYRASEEPRAEARATRWSGAGFYEAAHGIGAQADQAGKRQKQPVDQFIDDADALGQPDQDEAHFSQRSDVRIGERE